MEERIADANIGLGEEGEKSDQRAAKPGEAAEVHVQQQTDDSLVSDFGHLEIYILQTQNAANGQMGQLPPPGSSGPSNEPGEAAEAHTQQQTDSGMVSDLIHLSEP